jgi:selenide,water dikinase
MTSNAGGRAGDLLVLTKPLGVGAVVTARKRGRAPDDVLRRAVEVMVKLNDDAAAAAVGAGVRAMTDVTGFGLLGHLHHLCRESGLAAIIDADRVPALPGVEALLDHEYGISGGSSRNAAWAARFTSLAPGVERWRAQLLSDATTSGGLLIAVAPHRAPQISGAVIGELRVGSPGTICVR